MKWALGNTHTQTHTRLPRRAGRDTEPGFHCWYPRPERSPRPKRQRPRAPWPRPRPRGVIIPRRRSRARRSRDLNCGARCSWNRRASCTLPAAGQGGLREAGWLLGPAAPGQVRRPAQCWDRSGSCKWRAGLLAHPLPESGLPLKRSLGPARAGLVAGGMAPSLVPGARAAAWGSAGVEGKFSPDSLPSAPEWDVEGGFGGTIGLGIAAGAHDVLRLLAHFVQGTVLGCPSTRL